MESIDRVKISTTIMTGQNFHTMKDIIRFSSILRGKPAMGSCRAVLFSPIGVNSSFGMSVTYMVISKKEPSQIDLQSRAVDRTDTHPILFLC